MSRLGAVHAIVTGAAQPMGSATVRRLVAEGATVTATVKTETESATLREAFGPAVQVRQLDVTSSDGWKQLAGAQRCSELGMHALVHHAVVLRSGRLVEMPADELRAQLEVNLLAPALGIRELAPVMAHSGGGSIVAVACTTQPPKGEHASMFAATSWGLRGLIRSSAAELGPLGIRVNAVCPSMDLLPGRAVETPIGAAPGVLADRGRPRHATQGDVAAMVAFLLSDDSASCTAGDFVVDAGSAIA